MSFILLPMGRSYVDDMRLCSTSDRMLAVLPVLIAHENHETRMCWPSIARVAALAGVGKETVVRATNELELFGWLKMHHGGSGRVCYELGYRPYDPDLNSSDYTRIDRPVIMRGLWAAIPASAKRLYVAMRALSVMGHRASGEWISDPDESSCLDTDCSEAFLPASRLGPSDLCDVTGLSPRTFRYARSWLLDNELALVSDDVEGLILPFDPERYSPAVLKRLEAIKLDQKGRPRGGTLRSFRGVKKAAKRRANNSSKLACDRQ